MLDEQNKVVIDDLRGKNSLGMEVNFSADPLLKETVKIEISGNEAVIPIKDLYNFIFLIANAEQQEQLMPVRQTLVRKIVKYHIVEVKKDLRKGEKMKVRCETNVPVEIVEGLRGMMGKRVVREVGLPIIGRRK